MSRTSEARKRVAAALPPRARRAAAVLYNRYRSRRADWRARRRDLPSLSPREGAPQHVVCVVVDALRADAVDPEVTPFLDSLAGRDAVSPAPWTFPAVSSLVTGQYPHEHGAVRQSDGVGGADELTLPPRLPDDRRTLPEVFAGAGYRTYGAFAFFMPFLALAGNFERHALYRDAPAERVLAGYLDWLDAHREERTFAYLHLGDLHVPVDPPAPYRDAHGVDGSIPDLDRWAYTAVDDDGPAAATYRRHRRRLYRAAVDYVDDRLAAFHERLTAALTSRPLVVVTADHGEALWEHPELDARNFRDPRPAHSVRHGGTPFEAVVRVPLRWDGLQPGVDPEVQLSLVDVAPTLLATLGHPTALSTGGRSLLEPVPSDRVLLTESARYGHEKKAASLGGWKLIVSRGDEAAVGFSLPDERPVELPGAVERELRAAFSPWPDEDDEGAAVSGPARRRLRDLGYV